MSTARTINWKALVKRADNNQPEPKYPVYPFQHPRYERPLRPGQTYPWAPGS